MSATSGETTSACLREMAAKDPDLGVVEVDGEVLTYGDLDGRADRLATRLVADLGRGEHRIGLRCAGTIAMAVGAIGIARAGMVSVPIDPTAPEDRVRVVLEDVEAPLVLVDEMPEGDLGARVAAVLNYGADAPPGGIDVPQGPLASIVFTSGSTGVPKGIMVPLSHRVGLRPRLEMLEGYSDSARTAMLVAGTVGFAEAAVHSVVQNRSTLCAYEVRRLGTAHVARWLEEVHATSLVTVPTLLRLVVAAIPEGRVLEAVRLVMLTGETATWEDIIALRAHLPPDAIVHNMFGLTEAGTIARIAIDASTVLGSGPLPAGRPVLGATITIVDEEDRPVVTGERGEIVVAGDGCTLGYWRRPELTGRVFRPLEDGTRSVHTGDAGRIGPDGMLEHLGRLDHVVKISGNRVELGEIETALRSIPGVVAAAAATYVDASGSTRLTAFAVAEPGRVLDPFVLRAGLARRLPGAMVPDAVGLVEELPQLANGKLDRRSLPERALSPGATSDGTASQLQGDLVRLWCDVLDLDHVALDDDFFAFGGDSMRAARLFTEIERQLGIDRSVALLLEASTVRQLAAAIEAGSDALGLIVPCNPNGSRLPLFVVHDGIGDVFYASRLSAHIGSDQPVYAIQPALIDPATATETSIEQLARRYLDEVRRVRSHGPYLLYGFSLGGLIAFEMALQLQAAGEEVAFLGLGDSSAPRLGWLDRARGRLDEIGELDARARVDRAAALAVAQGRHLTSVLRAVFAGQHRRLPGSLPEAQHAGAHVEALPLEREERGNAVMMRYGALAASYRPATKFVGSVLLVRAEGPGYRPDRGWGIHVDGEVTTHDVDCEHAALGREPFARQVADIVAGALVRASVTV